VVERRAGAEEPLAERQQPDAAVDDALLDEPGDAQRQDFPLRPTEPDAAEPRIRDGVVTLAEDDPPGAKAESRHSHAVGGHGEVSRRVEVAGQVRASAREGRAAGVEVRLRFQLGGRHREAAVRRGEPLGVRRRVYLAHPVSERRAAGLEERALVGIAEQAQCGAPVEEAGGGLDLDALVERERGRPELIEPPRLRQSLAGDRRDEPCGDTRGSDGGFAVEDEDAGPAPQELPGQPRAGEALADDEDVARHVFPLPPSR
jgi:hypothetical protein